MFGVKSITVKFWLRYQWQKRVCHAHFIPPRPVFFVHIPKTAGTSFRNMLYRVIDPEVTYPNLRDLAIYEGHYPRPEQLEDYLSGIGRDIFFLAGHYPFAMGGLLAKVPDYYVFLRDPLARTISNLLHFQRNEPDCMGLDLFQIFDLYRKHLQNFQVRYLCDPSLTDFDTFYHAERVTEKSLEQAKDHLSRCAFIGLTEEFSTSVRLAEKLLGISLGNILKDNFAANIPEYDDPALAEYIGPAIQLDQKLYHHARILFEQQKAHLLNT
ncbi:MAG: sulfotransferase family 2 domain-containing protein [Saprospiraceae bacterium]|nr:sulfotransferase family 2 domain-containing protein [Lewinella sp.]